MTKKIKQLSAVFFIIFCIVGLFIGILNIWDIINNELAKEVFIKVLYTFGGLYVISLFIIYLTQKGAKN